MSWLDDITSFLGNNGNLLGNLVNVGGQLYSASQIADANQRARDAAIAGMREGAGIMSTAYDTALPQYTAGQTQARDALVAGQRAGQTAYGTGVDTGSGRLAGIEVQAAPAINQLAQTAGMDPSRLTPEQQIQYDDAVRRGSNRLATSGLRGAGRATAAVLSDLENRTRARLIDENQQRKTSAMNTLAGQGFGATRSRAGLDVDKGRYNAGAEETVGAANSRAAENIGNATSQTTLNKARGNAAAAEGSGVLNANATTANANVWGNALGSIAGTASGALKNAQTRPTYQDNPRNDPSLGLYARGGRVRRIAQIMPRQSPGSPRRAA